MFQFNLFYTALGNRIKLHVRVVGGQTKLFSAPSYFAHFVCWNTLCHHGWFVSFVPLKKRKEKKKAHWVTVRPPIYCCLPPVCPTWAPPEASLCLGCAACGSLRWDPGLYIEPLRTLCVQTFHSTSERLLPSMRNAALALITSHDQDHSVVSGWNWQAGFSLTLSKRARWEVLPAKTCVSTAVALRSFKENIKKKVGSSSLMTNSRTEDFMFYGDKARFRSGQVFWGTFRRTVFCLPATRLMINNQIGNLFYFLFFPNRCCDIGVVCERCPARLSSPLPRFWFLCIQRKCLHLISRTHLLNTSAPSSATCALEMRFGLISVTELKI